MDPWFPFYLAWIPGTAIGCLGGVWGSMVGILAPRGKAKTVVFATAWAMLAASAAMLIAATAALVVGQPWGIWYSLGLPGAISATIFGVLLPAVRHWYRQAEERRMKAQDF